METTVNRTTESTFGRNSWIASACPDQAQCVKLSGNAIGNAVGLLFAVLVLTIRVTYFPLLLDRMPALAAQLPPWSRW